MGNAAVVVRLSVVTIGEFLSMGGTIYTLSNPLPRPSPPVFLGELACSCISLILPTSFALVAVREAFLSVSLSLLAIFCFNTDLLLTVSLEKLSRALYN